MGSRSGNKRFSNLGQCVKVEKFVITYIVTGALARIAQLYPKTIVDALICFESAVVSR
jgi:hypothetical protein